MSESIEVYEAHPMTLVGTPDSILEEATVAANALMNVVKKAGLAHNFGGKKDHLEFEAWQTLAKFYGESVHCVEVRFVQYGSAQGFEAISEVRDRCGTLVSRAEAMCLNDEDKWKSKPKYGYVYICKDGTKSLDNPGKDQIIWENKRPKKERIKIGDEPVPLFQLRSMAQTRSNAKALKNRFAWIVVLAGYSATPAEEMIHHDDPPPDEGKPPVQQPKEKKADPGAESNGDARMKLAQELESYCSGDIEMMNDVCHQVSAFGTNNGFAATDIVIQKDDGSYKISDKWIGTALGSLRKMVEAQGQQG